MNEDFGMGLNVGDRLPDFRLEDQNGDQRSPESARGRWLVLFFYPKDDTPGCTAEVCSFQSNLDVFQTLNADIWGISGDDVVSHRRFSARHNLSYPILSDRNNNLRRQMGVPKALGMMMGRVTYVVDPDGVIRHMFSNLLDGPAHVREAERMIRSFNS